MANTEGMYRIAQECRSWVHLTVDMMTEIPKEDRVLVASAFISQIEAKAGCVMWWIRYCVDEKGSVDLNKVLEDIRFYVKGHIAPPEPFMREEAAQLIRNKHWPIISYLEDGFDLEVYVTEDIYMNWGVFTITELDGKCDTVMHTMRDDIVTAVQDYVNEHLGGDPDNLDTCETPIIVQVVDTSDM